MATKISFPKMLETSKGLLRKNGILYNKDQVLLVFHNSVETKIVENWVAYLFSGAITEQAVESIEFVLERLKILDQGLKKAYILDYKDIAVMVTRYPSDKGRIAPPVGPIPIIEFLGIRQLKNIAIAKPTSIYAKGII